MPEICKATYLGKHFVAMASAIVACSGLLACLAPVAPYQKNNFESASNNLSKILITQIAGRRGQVLRTLLEQRFATIDKKRKTHKLQVKINVQNRERNFSRERIIGQVVVNARFTLSTNKNTDNKILLRASFSERSDYTVLSEFFARRDAKSEAIMHALDRVAGEITLRLRLHFFAENVKKQKNKTKNNDKKPAP